MPLLFPSSVRLAFGAALLALAPLTLSAQGLLSGTPATTVVQSEQARAELLAHAPDGVSAGKPVWVGLQITHAPEWHTYWKNSGDSGLPTELRWTLPTGVVAGDIAWPTPRKFPIGNLANYGYDGTVVLPVPLTVSPDFKGSHLDVQLDASWLVCRKECIPEEGRFALRIPVQGSTALNGAAFDASFQAAPKDQTAQDSRAEPAPSVLKVALNGLPGAWRGQKLEFFPELPGVIEPGAAWTQGWSGERWSAEVPLSPHRTDSPARFALVVAPAAPPGHGPGSAGVRIDLPVQGNWPTAAAPPAAVPAALQAALAENAASAVANKTGASALTLGAALAGALLGGLILNLMPCVFPVLAIKITSFAKQADDRRGLRINGVAYTLGVVLSFLALGGLLLALRAGGEELGWGFQLQSPAVVAALAALFTLIGLNLAGLFEFGRMLPSGVANLQAKNRTTDAFLTGVLATAIASPCTAPFMGASLGLAIALPTEQALAVFAMLGLGMALPYLLASWVPAVARALPKPGAWMDSLRRFMAFPMFATVVWLVWVLGQQSGIDGAAALLMLLVVLALLVWSLGLSGKGRKAIAGLSLLGLVWLGWAIGPNVTRVQSATAIGASVATSVDGVSWQPWSPQAQADLVAQGRPVFVDFTAAWCVTCQYNKRSALADNAVLKNFAAKNVALLRADWTRRDPEVTAALAQLGRNGVPVYAIYKNGQPIQLLSELLSVQEVLEALAPL
ncbi:protein-disulfide reductase DsbD [Hydrogenophaga sp.]|uniref:protein-disulfide reductase DsbD family protein n=1 Tax=Hydrogenophaga sp. TaxID=1904254 RepID=UPI00271BF096|nr:thioredoxin family protein [Hydrogenophaga sp.]MDO9437896.1 protein-disulfide reductase DsbD family protein [Hydrogenophaga sp.]